MKPFCCFSCWKNLHKIVFSSQTVMNRIIFFHDFPLIYSYVKRNPILWFNPTPGIMVLTNLIYTILRMLSTKFQHIWPTGFWKKRFSLFYSLVKMKPILWFNAELFICTRPKGVSTQVLAWLSGQIVFEKFLKIFFDIFLYKEDYLKEVTKFQ